MLFNSLAFAIFLPIVFIIYWIMPHKYRWVLLLGASYYFYMCWNAKYIVLIVFTTVISYVAGRLLEKERNKRKKKLILASAVVLCLGVLFFFKYFNFVSESITSFLNLFAIQMNPITLKILLPVGISFYTFQTLSYVIDVYKGDVPAEYHFGYYATFISFFPQLVAGPIERTRNLLPQLKSEKSFDYDNAIYGARQILWGLFKKVVVADVVSIYVDRVYSNLYGCTSFDFCIAIFFFSIQIYCDFSGYSEIAIGTARLFNINLLNNFSSPYFSTSIKEFWSRWHISLSAWFRDYVYIPLGGNRCSAVRNYVNLMVTFIVSGLWHGANWTFIFWGGVHGCAQLIEKIFCLDKIKKGKFGKMIAWLIVFAFCNLAWVFFRADSFQDAFFVIGNAFSGVTDIHNYMHTSIGLPASRLMYILAMIGLVFLFDYVLLKKDIIDGLGKTNIILRLTVEYGVIACIIYESLHSVGANQFVYFQF